MRHCCSNRPIDINLLWPVPEFCYTAFGLFFSFSFLFHLIAIVCDNRGLYFLAKREQSHSSEIKHY